MPNTFTDTPIASHTLAFDQPLIEGNFLYVQGALGKDHQVVIGHTDTGTTFEGRHTQVSLNDRGNTNLAMPGDGTDSLLWSSGGNIYFKNTTIASGVQLTDTNLVPSAATNGKSFLPGGIIIQWGAAGATADGTLVNFPQAFTNLFSCTISHTSAGAAENTGSIVSAASKTTSGFTLRVNGSATASYSYVAIGN